MYIYIFFVGGGGAYCALILVFALYSLIFIYEISLLFSNH